jgi:hypothetical protein
VILLLVVLLAIGAFKFVGSLFGVGISFPPNACDLKFGYEFVGDLGYSSRDLCLHKLAEEKMDPQICKGISYGSKTCLTILAISMENPALCAKIPKSNTRRYRYDRDYCFLDYVKEIPSESVCLEIEDTGIKKDCYFVVMSYKAQIEGSIEYCFNNLTLRDSLICIKENAGRKDICAAGMIRLFEGERWNEYLGRSIDSALSECR